VIRRYIERITGYSRAQVSRLIRRYKQTGQLKKMEYGRHRFPRKYTPSEVGLLAKTDELHEWLSGPASKKIMGREYEVYGHSEFGNISRISVAHLYNFTKSRPRHTDDNGLVETKNGSVLRKNLGYAHIPQACAELLNEYHKGYLNPYINFHRPCFFPVSVIDHKGKIKKTYPYEEVMIPCSFNKSQDLLKRP